MLGVCSLDPSAGLTVPDRDEAFVKSAMVIHVVIQVKAGCDHAGGLAARDLQAVGRSYSNT